MQMFPLNVQTFAFAVKQDINIIDEVRTFWFVLMGSMVGSMVVMVTHGGVVPAQGLLPDRQRIVQEVGCLLVLVLIPGGRK